MHAAVFRLCEAGRDLQEIQPAVLGQLYVHQRAKNLHDREAWLLGEKGEHLLPYLLPAHVQRITAQGIVITGVEHLPSAPGRKWSDETPRQKWVCWIRATPFDKAPAWPVKAPRE